MSLVNVTLPLGSFERLVRGIEKIADTLDRQFPSPLTAEDLRLSEPKDGITIVTDEMILEEEARESLRLQGYRPDDIEKLIQDGENETAA